MISVIANRQTKAAKQAIPSANAYEIEGRFYICGHYGSIGTRVANVIANLG
jgi:hypothetical protein